MVWGCLVTSNIYIGCKTKRVWLMQKRSNSSASALELHLFCMNKETSYLICTDAWRLSWYRIQFEFNLRPKVKSQVLCPSFKSRIVKLRPASSLCGVNDVLFWSFWYCYQGYYKTWNKRGCIFINLQNILVVTRVWLLKTDKIGQGYGCWWPSDVLTRSLAAIMLTACCTTTVVTKFDSYKLMLNRLQLYMLAVSILHQNTMRRFVSLTDLFHRLYKLTH